jgi:hypothetical protein
MATSAQIIDIYIFFNAEIFKEYFSLKENF